MSQMMDEEQFSELITTLEIINTTIKEATMTFASYMWEVITIMKKSARTTERALDDISDAGDKLAKSVEKMSEGEES